MKVERQGENECMLATLAALSGQPLAIVRRLALGHAGADCWARMLRERDRYWTAVDATAADLRMERFLDAVKAALREAQSDREARSDALAVLAGNAPPSLPAVGRGAVLAVSPRTGHIMPWQDGLVFDPESEDPSVGITLPEYRRRRPYGAFKVIRYG
jgi:hypothetical protein